MNFDDCYWHDSVLKCISIDRSNPGISDIVEMNIEWYDEPESKIVFKEVYLFKATMNFGIIARESIDTAYIAPPDDEDLLNFYKIWKGFYDGVKLNCYIIRTSSTGSEIKILAERVEMIQI